MRPSRGDMPSPPYSLGQVGLSQPRAPIFFQNCRMKAQRSGSSSKSHSNPSYSAGYSAARKSATSCRSSSSFGVV